MGEKVCFQLKKRDGVQMAGEGTLDAETFQDPSVFTPPKTQAKGSTKKAKLTMKSKEGSFREAGYNNLLPAQSKEILFCAAIAAVWVFDAKNF